MAHGKVTSVLKSFIDVNNFEERLLKRSKILGYDFFIQSFVHNVPLYEAGGNEISFVAKCYQSMRKSETPHKLKLIVADDR
jgi:hypothetical protein